MHTYAQYCPISRALDVLGERWTLLIVRDMLTGSRRFNDLARGLPGISRGLLSRRLRQLEAGGIVTRGDDGYLLTPAGEDLAPLVFGLAEWGAQHAFGEPRPEELDPELLMWWLQGSIEPEGLDRRAVLQIDVRDRRRLFWLVLEPGEVSVCHTDPGFEVDAVLRSSLSDLYRLWEGHVDLLDAVRHGSMDLTGARWLIRSLPRWLQASPVVPYVRSARAKATATSG